MNNAELLEQRIDSLNSNIDKMNFVNDFSNKAAQKIQSDIEWDNYSIAQIQEMFSLTDKEALKLMKSGIFRVHRSGNEYRASRKSVQDNIKILNTVLDYRNHKTMTIPEMGRILGVGRTSAYRIAEKQDIKSYLVFGEVRIDVESFEEWYAQQFHFKKVNGEKPGLKYGDTMDTVDIARILGIGKTTAYDLLKRGDIDYIVVKGKRRVLTESFEKWYSSQNKYKKSKEN